MSGTDRMGRARLRICLACAPGGHLTELRALLPAIAGYSYFWAVGDGAVLDEFGAPRHVLPDYGERQVLKRLKALVALALASVRVFWIERPNVLITTGPLTGFFLALMVRASGGLVIYIECSACVTAPSKAGRLFYWISNFFFIQWDTLRDHYPRARHGGLIL